MSEEPEADPDPESDDRSNADDDPESVESGPAADGSDTGADGGGDTTPAEENHDAATGETPAGRDEDGTSGDADAESDPSGDGSSDGSGPGDDRTDDDGGLQRVDDEGAKEPPEDAGDDPVAADDPFEESAPSAVDPDGVDSWEEFNEEAAEREDAAPPTDPLRTPRPENPEEYADERSPEDDEDAGTVAGEGDPESPRADVPPGPDADADLVAETPPEPEPADPEGSAPGAVATDGEHGHATPSQAEGAGLDPEEGPFADSVEGTGEVGEQPVQPPDDEEMPLAVHVEEMVKRLGIVVVTAGTVSLLAYPFTEQLILAIWQGVLPAADAPLPYLFGPLEKIITQLKLAGLIGLVAGLPMLVYQSYRFMRPGLYPHERKYYLAAVPTSLVLAGIGIAFSYFAVLPALFVYFMYYSEGSVDIIAFGLSKTFELILTLLGLLAVVFQIPLFIMLAIMMGVTSRRWLEDNRIYFWGGFLGVAFLFAPDPTGMAPFIVAITEVALFEGTLLILRWVDR